MAAVAALAESAWRRSVSAPCVVRARRARSGASTVQKGGAIGDSDAHVSRRDFRRRDKAKKARRTQIQDNSTSGAMEKQRRWNSCCSTTRIVVAPQPRPDQQTSLANERETDERQNGVAAKGTGIVATTAEDAKADIAEAAKSNALRKSQRKVKKLKKKLVVWQQRAEDADAASQRQEQIDRLQEAAAEATKERNSLLNYVPGDWDSVPEQRRYENASHIAQQIKEQEDQVADIVRRAERRMEREVKSQVTAHEAQVEALHEKLQKLLKGNTKGNPKDTQEIEV